ncbi:MAG TPA: hypothetical protein VD833_24930 [Vicinamibacterales bacterium]|nr:hypothetical protein [Vicinamibacterales bacterium]
MRTFSTRTRLALTAGTLALAVVAAGANGQKFYPDDPITRIVDSQDASGVQEFEIDLTYDTLENLFYWPGDRTPDVRALNLNTIDEVPDSNWFTNRLGTARVTVDELVKGPGAGAGPAPGGWTAISAKNDGVMPGFTVRDSADQVWFIKFDPPGYPAMATGTEVLVSRLFWGLGYNVPEVHLATLSIDQLTIDEEARITVPSGKKRALRMSDVELALRRAHREADGSYRVVASKALPGRVIGGFRFYGTRPDDPNDVIPHEHRRELRGYGTFAAWLNHVDSKSINTLDTVVAQDGRQVVRHHLLDFGSAIGSAGVYPREAYEGQEYLVEGKKTLAGMPSFGFYIKDWRTMPVYKARSVGRFPIDNAQWDPEDWKPRYPNSASRAARMDDKFWAARRLQAFTDEMLNTLIGVGRFDDPQSEEMLSKFLIERRNAIVRRYLPAVNPVVNVRLSASGTLTFENAAVDAGVASPPAEYVAKWSRFDNARGVATPIGDSGAATASIAAPKDLPSTAGTYIRVEIAAKGGPESWTVPAHAYFRRDGSGWTLVGFERVPGGNPPGAKTAKERTN